jgi:hypothetical protein
VVRLYHAAPSSYVYARPLEVQLAHAKNLNDGLILMNGERPRRT